MIKLILLFFCMMNANAIPVLNELYPNDEFLTLFKDSEDNNLLYVFPSDIKISRDETSGRLHFKYKEFKKGFRKKAIIQAEFRLAFAKHKVKRLLEDSKNDKLSVVPISFTNSSLKLGKVLQPFIESQSCDQTIGQSESTFACEIVISSKGVKNFRKILKAELSFILYVSFDVDALVKDQDGSFIPKSSSFSVSGSINHIDFYYNSDYFLDHKGRSIPVTKPIETGEC